MASLDMNNDGHVSNVEFSAALKEVDGAGGKGLARKHPLIAKILFDAVVLFLCAVAFGAGWLLYRYHMIKELIIGIVIVSIIVIYIAVTLIKGYRRRKRISRSEP